MSESSTPAQIPADKPAFPVERLLFAVGFAVLAWFVFWALIVLAAVQFVVVAVNGHSNDDLKRFSLSLLNYLGEVLRYIVFGGDNRPFPFGPFPTQAS
ncbi:MAG TPA: DUF4389 domain-containing protein [Rhizomicrobium sp.]|jgi:hypothetical protein|nr:DUF4389 domain-containing protein [Rhizomicrobium sp.]